jgi:hypothetical protein
MRSLTDETHRLSSVVDRTKKVLPASGIESLTSIDALRISKNWLGNDSWHIQDIASDDNNSGACSFLALELLIAGAYIRNATRDLMRPCVPLPQAPYFQKRKWNQWLSRHVLRMLACVGRSGQSVGRTTALQ